VSTTCILCTAPAAQVRAILQGQEQNLAEGDRLVLLAPEQAAAQYKDCGHEVRSFRGRITEHNLSFLFASLALRPETFVIAHATWFHQNVLQALSLLQYFLPPFRVMADNATVRKQLDVPAYHRLIYSKLRASYYDTKGHVLYSYKGKDGAFDYEEYKRIQVEGNVQKLAYTFAKQHVIVSLAEYLRAHIAHPLHFGLCHGVRRGSEVQWFREALGVEVLGTEISHTATQFPNTIEWDFHNVKPEWVEAVDFIYSNSWDHSYDPELCLTRWMSCIKPGGLCLLEHTPADMPRYVTPLDPFRIRLDKFVPFINRLGRGRFAVKQVLVQAGEDISHVVIEKRA
jgi:hypothetical protein